MTLPNYDIEFSIIYGVGRKGRTEGGGGEVL